jgi:regulator of sirC expression with transglutaminase-like and TPR domain
MIMDEDYRDMLPQHVRESEFVALIDLLDDPDPSVCLLVRQKLKSYGGEIAWILRILLADEDDEHRVDSILFVLQSFQQDVLVELLDMVQEASDTGNDIDLEAAIIRLSRFGYPETSNEAVKQRLDEIALRIHAVFMKSPQQNELNLLLSINQAFFEEEQFFGAPDWRYHDPANTYVHTLLEKKCGIPISLCTLYLLVAERAGVVLHGVGMPAHFVVYHPELDIFIDTFNKGAFLSREDCKRFIEGAGFKYEPSMLDNVSNTAILLRMIRNLIFAYTRTGLYQWHIAALQEISAAIVETMNQEES